MWCIRCPMRIARTCSSELKLGKCFFKRACRDRAFADEDRVDGEVQ
jgi:hypothetical protein